MTGVPITRFEQRRATAASFHSSLAIQRTEIRDTIQIVLREQQLRESTQPKLVSLLMLEAVRTATCRALKFEYLRISTF